MYCAHCDQPRPDSDLPCPHCGAPNLRAGSPGGFWLRLLAGLIDLVFCTVLAMFAAIPLSLAISALMGATTSEDMRQTVGAVLGYSLIIAIVWLYAACWEASSWQATPGKKILRLSVSDDQGARLGFRQSAVRQAARVVATLAGCVGLLMIVFDKDKRGWHDRVTGTRVTLD